MNICAVQLDIRWEDKAANFTRVRELLAKRRPAPGSLIILPEMFSTGFSMNLAVTQQTAKREDEAFLASLAMEYAATVMGGVVLPGDGGKALNQCVTCTPQGEVAARYTKIHPFSLGGESQCHAAGSELVAFNWSGFTVAPFICYDLRFPELFRAAARRGADLLVVIALWPVKRIQHWITLLQARAIENQAFVVGVNRVGNEPDYSYCGRTLVVNPHGIIIADAGEQEGVLHAMPDLGAVASWRRDFPALRDAHWKDESQPQPGATKSKEKKLPAKKVSR